MDSSIDDSPAVKALGPLFKLTEVHLWDCGSSEVQESHYFQESITFTNGVEDFGKGDNASTIGFCSVTKDLELAQQMNDLGLPLSFSTNKTRYGMTSGKRKGTRKSNQQSSIEIDDCMLDSIKAHEDENISPPPSLLNTDIPKNEIVPDNLSNFSLERRDSLSSTACTSTLCNEDEAESVPCSNETLAAGLSQDCGTSEGSCLINEGVDCDGKEIVGGMNSLHLETLLVDHDIDGQSNHISLEAIKDSERDNTVMINTYQIVSSGEWVAYWDDFHGRMYFYNAETEESTWDPPPGMEHHVYVDMVDEATYTMSGLSELGDDQIYLRTSVEAQASCDLQSPHELAKELRSDALLLSQELDGIAGNGLSADYVSSTNTRSKKKKARRTKSNRMLSISSEDLQGVLREVPSSISKYWCQRYLLFSRFGEGIKMDEEGWFSVTPEPIAKHHAARCGHGAIVDFFTGVGGNAIQFAKWSKHVIAIDIDPTKIEYARHNAAIYGVDDRIDFMNGDSFSLAPKLKADTVFMSPPWGGPAYSKVKKFDINTMLKPREGQFLFDAGKRIASKMVMFLPRNVDINQLAELSLSATPPWSLEVERNFLNGRLKAVTAYFSQPSMS
ncbi:hypothetical protein ACS0TY_013116 [Phlomoides rotata]